MACVGSSQAGWFGTHLSLLSRHKPTPTPSGSDAYSTLVLSSSPVGYWRLDETSGSTANDISGHGYNMTYGTSVSKGSTGLLAAGVSTDKAATIPATPITAVGTIGASYAANLLQPTTAVTIEAWVKPTAIANVVFASYGDEATGPQYAIGMTAGGYLWGSVNLTSATSWPLAATAPLVAGTSYYVAMTHDTATGANVLYVNGVAVSTNTYTGTITGYASPYGFQVGNDAAFSNTVNSAGVVDEVAVYATALSAPTLLAQYNAGTGSSSTPTPTPTPTATPTPSPAPSSTAYADGNVAPAGWQFPLSPNPFTLQACVADPCTPLRDTNDTAEVTSLMNGAFTALGSIYEGNAVFNTFPVYYGGVSDPTYTVTCNGGGCGLTGSATVHIPNGATASGGQDHHMTVINLSTSTEFDLYEVNAGQTLPTWLGNANPLSGGGALTVWSMGQCTESAFVGNVNACGNGGIESGNTVQNQILDPREIMSGSINHVLYIDTTCSQNTTMVFPAANTTGDGRCGSSGPKYGQRVWLDLTDIQINALGSSAWEKTILHAMHHYGFMVDDGSGGVIGNGSSPWGFEVLDPASFTLWGQTDPWLAFWATASPGSQSISLPTTGITQSQVHILDASCNLGPC
jgi:hypothetical protein